MLEIEMTGMINTGKYSERGSGTVGTFAGVDLSDLYLGPDNAD